MRNSASKSFPIAPRATRESTLRAVSARRRRFFVSAGDQGGFVLLEILLSIALFSTVSVAMVHALDQIADTSIYGRREAQMVERLDSEITRASNSPRFEAGQWQTETDDFGISTITTIEPADIVNDAGETLEGIWRIYVEVTWTDGVRREMRTSETLVNQNLNHDRETPDAG